MTDHDMDQQITRTLPHAVRVPRVIYRPQALNLCMSRESCRTSKSNIGNWKRMEREIDLATSNLEFHVSSPVLNWNCMNMDEVGSHVEACPSSSFRRFEPFTAQNTPRGSFAKVFSVVSSASSDSLWEKERVRYNTCVVPGLTKLIGWWQFNVQRASTKTTTLKH